MNRPKLLIHAAVWVAGESQRLAEAALAALPIPRALF